MEWGELPAGTARVVLSEPEFGHESRVSAITVACLDHEGDTLLRERITFAQDDYLATYDQLLALIDKLNARLRSA